MEALDNLNNPQQLQKSIPPSQKHLGHHAAGAAAAAGFDG